MAGSHHQLPRDLAAQFGCEALAILEGGTYTAPSGRTVDLKSLIDHAVRNTTSYPADLPIESSAQSNFDTDIKIANVTTLSAAKQLLDQGFRTAALNFASATHPGGGFLTGARAQEEYLARSSALYACLRDNPMYSFHQNHYDPVYSDYLIYSPDVPVFRGDDGVLLETPYTLSIITAAAVNAQRVPTTRQDDIPPAMRKRILKVLGAAVRHDHDAIVLGAWGCGAFGNDGRVIAELFHESLIHRFRGAFARVVFAIRDWSEDKRFIGPFEHAFQDGR